MLVASDIVHSLVRQLQRFRVGPATAHSEGRDATAVTMCRMSAKTQSRPAPARLKGMRGLALTGPAPFVDQREGSPVASVAVFFFCFVGEVRGKLGSVTSSHAPERRLNVRFMSRTTPFASVGDILKAVGEEDRRDFHYCHLAF